jgi:hypothetical protein
VTFSGSSTNLHSVWDTKIVEKAAAGSGLTGARSYATSLTNSIKSGTWSTSSWMSGLDINNPQSSAMKWASDANGYVCTDVIPNGVAAVESGDLSGQYYTDHVHAVRIELARGKIEILNKSCIS